MRHRFHGGTQGVLRGEEWPGATAACDSRLVITHSTNRHGVTYPYFICSGRHRKRTTCTRQAVLIDWVAQQIEGEYATISLPSEIAEALVAMVTRDFAELHQSSERDRRRLQGEHDRLRAEQASLLQAHYAGAVPLDLLKQEQSRISSRLSVLTQRLDGAATEHARAQANLQICIAHLNDCHAAYLQAPPTVRRQFNRAFFHKIYVDEDGTVRFDLAEPFGALLDPPVRAAALRSSGVADSPTSLRRMSITGNSATAQACHRFGQGLNKTTMVALGAQLSHLRPEVSRLERVRSRHGGASTQHRGEAAGGRSSLSAGRPPQQRVTDDLLSDLIAGSEAGETTYQLAHKHGLNRNTVAAHLRSAGVTIRMDGMTPEQIAQAAEYYREGWSLARVGREVGADAETVRKRLRQQGVTIRTR